MKKRVDQCIVVIQTRKKGLRVQAPVTKRAVKEELARKYGQGLDLDAKTTAIQQVNPGHAKKDGLATESLVIYRVEIRNSFTASLLTLGFSALPAFKWRC